MPDIISSLINRDPRFRFRSPEKFTVTVILTNGDEQTNVPGKLLDISCGGAKILIDRPAIVKDSIRVQMSCEEFDISAEWAAEVCWLSPPRSDGWVIGCSFEPRIPEDLLETLFDTGELERRQHQRQEVSLRMTLRWEACSEQGVAWILNVSEGGFCMLTNLAGSPPQRVSLATEGDEDLDLNIVARSKWQVQTEEGFCVGCEFVSNQTFKSLQQLIGDGKKVSLWQRLTGRS